MSDVFLAPRDLATVVIGGDYTLVGTDPGKTVDVDGAIDTVTITVPDNATVAIPVGAIIEIANLTGETVNIVGDTGVTVNSFDEDGLSSGSTAARELAGRFAVAALRKVDTDVWLLTGQLTGLA